MCCISIFFLFWSNEPRLQILNIWECGTYETVYGAIFTNVLIAKRYYWQFEDITGKKSSTRAQVITAYPYIPYTQVELADLLLVQFSSSRYPITPGARKAVRAYYPAGAGLWITFALPQSYERRLTKHTQTKRLGLCWMLPGWDSANSIRKLANGCSSRYYGACESLDRFIRQSDSRIQMFEGIHPILNLMTAVAD